MNIDGKYFSELLSKAIRATGKPESIAVYARKDEVILHYNVNSCQVYLRQIQQNKATSSFGIETDLLVSILKQTKEIIDFKIENNSLSFSAKVKGKNIALLSVEAVKINFDKYTMYDKATSAHILFMLNYSNLDNPDITTKDFLQLHMIEDGADQVTYCATQYYAAVVKTNSIKINLQFFSNHARQIATTFNNQQFYLSPKDDMLVVGNEQILFRLPVMQTTSETIAYKTVKALEKNKVVNVIKVNVNELLDNINVAKHIAEENQPFDIIIKNKTASMGFTSNKGSISCSFKTKFDHVASLKFNARHLLHILNKLKEAKQVKFLITDSGILHISAFENKVNYYLTGLQ